MTAILAVVALAGTTAIPPEGFAAGVRSLGGFAPFGADEVDSDVLRLWVARSFRSTGLAAADGRVLAIDGRLRDRAEFVKRHALAGDASDAALILAAYAARGPALFESLDADIALLLVDAPARRVILFRDVLGERGLRYAVRGTQLQASSRGSAIVAMRGETLVPNEVAMAHYFALRAPPDEVAWMQGVEELPAGGLLLFEDGQRRYRRFTPDLPTEPLRFRSDAEAAEAWRDVVAGAVARACADARTPTIMLSGGVDSTLIAAFLDPARARAVSWSLPSMPECDEVQFASATASMLGLPHDIINGDAFPPLSDIATWPMEDEAPNSNAYRRVKQALFAEARSSGTDVLLSGHFGDHRYATARGWSRAFLRERGALALLQEFWAQAGSQGWANVLSNSGWKGFFPISSSLPPPSWITEQAARLVTPFPQSRDRLIDLAYGRVVADDGDLDRRFANAEALELRNVYRDPILMKFTLALPCHYSASLRGSKWLTREILTRRVPENVRWRPKAGDLTPWFRRGVWADQRALRSVLLGQHALWRSYVVDKELVRALDEPLSGRDMILVWHALSSELWRGVHLSQGAGLLASTSLVAAGGGCNESSSGAFNRERVQDR